MSIELYIELISRRMGKVDASHQFHRRLTKCQNYQFYLNPIYSGNQNFRCKQGTIHSLYVKDHYGKERVFTGSPSEMTGHAWPMFVRVHVRVRVRSHDFVRVRKEKSLGGLKQKSQSKSLLLTICRLLYNDLLNYIAWLLNLNQPVFHLSMPDQLNAQMTSKSIQSFMLRIF